MSARDCASTPGAGHSGPRRDGARRARPTTRGATSSPRRGARALCKREAMAYEHDLIHVAVDDGVAVATIDAPPMNVMTIPLYVQLAQLCAELAAARPPRGGGFRSAGPPL